jgi:hypothetical protein
MQLMKNSAFANALFAAVSLLTILATPAIAEDASGKFTLTKEVHWGPVVLAPGDYTYKLEHRSSDVVVVRALDGEPGFLVIARSVSPTKEGETDRLVLRRQGDEWFVSSMVISGLEEELHFSAPLAYAEPVQAKLASLSKP